LQRNEQTGNKKEKIVKRSKSKSKNDRRRARKEERIGERKITEIRDGKGQHKGRILVKQQIKGGKKKVEGGERANHRTGGTGEKHHLGK